MRCKNLKTNMNKLSIFFCAIGLVGKPTGVFLMLHQEKSFFYG
jgi:hypothetical protein